MHDHLKTVVITGGTKGIGAAIAELFYRNGHAVVVCSRSDNGFAKRLGRGAFFVKADATKPAQMKMLMAKALRLTGRVDAVVNCAGHSQWKPIGHIDAQFLDEMLEVNLKSTFFACQAALPHLKRGGSIVNVASLAGKRGSAKIGRAHV